ELVGTAGELQEHVRHEAGLVLHGEDLLSDVVGQAGDLGQRIAVGRGRGGTHRKSPCDRWERCGAAPAAPDRYHPTGSTNGTTTNASRQGFIACASFPSTSSPTTKPKRSPTRSTACAGPTR